MISDLDQETIRDNLDTYLNYLLEANEEASYREYEGKETFFSDSNAREITITIKYFPKE